MGRLMVRREGACSPPRPGARGAPEGDRVAAVVDLELLEQVVHVVLDRGDLDESRWAISLFERSSPTGARTWRSRGGQTCLVRHALPLWGQLGRRRRPAATRGEQGTGQAKRD
jgi:hypothetical protein